MQVNSIGDGVFDGGDVTSAMTQPRALIRKRPRGCCYSLVSETKWPLDNVHFRPHELQILFNYLEFLSGSNQCSNILSFVIRLLFDVTIFRIEIDWLDLIKLMNSNLT